MEIDFGLALNFVDTDGKPRQLRFRRNWADIDSPEIFDGTGQLIAVVTGGGRSPDEIALTRAGVNEAAVMAALDGWQTWAATLEPRQINLAEIRRRIAAAGLA